MTKTPTMYSALVGIAAATIAAQFPVEIDEGENPKTAFVAAVIAAAQADVVYEGNVTEEGNILNGRPVLLFPNGLAVIGQADPVVA